MNLLNLMRKLFLILLISLPLVTFAQFVPEHKPVPAPSMADFGVGVGLDYGGIGIRFTVLPEKHIGLFGSIGYALAGPGYNFGARFRFNPDRHFCFVAGGMYGYNAAIKVTGGPAQDKLYYGTSIFAGGELHFRSNPKNYLSMELIVPFRDPAYQSDIDALKASGYSVSDPIPIAISIGYHFGF